MSALDGWTPPLDTGETLLWQDRPDPSLYLRDFFSGQALFGVFFTLFSCVWFLGARSMGSMGGGFDIFPYLIAPFFLIGLYMVILRPFHIAYRHGRTRYALSDRAAYIARLGLGQLQVKRYPFADMNILELDDDTPGSVRFRREVHVSTYRTRSRNGFSRKRTRRTEITIGFERITSARQVYRLIADRSGDAQRP